MATLPTYEQIEYQSRRLHDRRARVATRLIIGEHIEKVALLISTVGEDGLDDPTPHDVASEILQYLAINVIEPLLAEPPVEASDG